MGRLRYLDDKIRRKEGKGRRRRGGERDGGGGGRKQGGQTLQGFAGTEWGRTEESAGRAVTGKTCVNRVITGFTSLGRVRMS